MEDPNCENYSTCKLVTKDDFKLERDKKINYMNTFCTKGKVAWQNCKRYTTKEALGFCPDFVLPDSDICLAEIIDQFDNENELIN